MCGRAYGQWWGRAYLCRGFIVVVYVVLHSVKGGEGDRLGQHGRPGLVAGATAGMLVATGWSLPLLGVGLLLLLAVDGLLMSSRGGYLVLARGGGAHVVARGGAPAWG